MTEDVEQMKAEIQRLTQGSAWRQSILNFVMAAEADGKVKELINEQVRLRQEELCRTEDRYVEVSEALRDAGIEFRDGRLWLERAGQQVPLEEVLGTVSVP